MYTPDKIKFMQKIKASHYGMKKIIALTTLIFFVASSMCQIPGDAEYTKDYYLKKSEKQKKIGWAMLTAAMVAGTVPLLLKPDHASENPYYIYNDKSKTAAMLILSGIALGSIPFFISSSKNKKRAAEISFQNQNFIFPTTDGVELTSVPAITLKLDFRTTKKSKIH